MNVHSITKIRIISLICIFVITAANTFWVILIFMIENNKMRVLKLYSEIKVVDAKLSLSKCLNLMNNITIVSEDDVVFQEIDLMSHNT